MIPTTPNTTTKMAFIDYLKLIRFEWHITFLAVVLGALFFSTDPKPSLFASLLLLYASFNVLLYGGIYMLNDVADVKSDREHSMKRKRPLPSGKVSVKSVMIISFTLITAGLLTGFLLFNRPIFYTYIAILALNIFYTFIAKKVPYLELVTNSVTHPLRFLMGVLLVSNKIPYLSLLAIFFLYLGLACVRRIVEKDVKGWEARKALKFYSGRTLLFVQLASFFAIILLSAIDTSVSKLLYLLIIAVYTTIAFGIYISDPIRALFRRTWTR